jgi:predicted DNA-binding transcriptional regulator YafY
VTDLAAEMSVSDKTIRRDIELLRSVGFPVENKLGDHGQKKWVVRDSSNSPSLQFTFDEALSLLLSSRYLTPMHGTMFWEACERALHKIRANLGEEAKDYVERMMGHLHGTFVGQGSYATQSSLIDQLVIAIEDSKQAIILYQSIRSTEPVEYAVDPYACVFHQGSLYLIAYSHDHGEIRHFKVDRISEIERSELPFERPQDFSMDKHLSGSFGIFQRHDRPVRKARVRFTSVAARHVQESRWHESQVIEFQRHGEIILSVSLSAFEEFQSWVLSFGSQAEVLEPDELRTSISAEIQEALVRYQQSTSPERPVIPSNPKGSP